jgi:hypothetical protein
VNGVKVGEQTLENEHPGEFFEVDYPLPATIAPEKSPRIVRFQAKPGLRLPCRRGRGGGPPASPHY